MTTTEERWAAAERTLDVGRGRRIRRTPGVVVGIVALLVLVVGLTAAVDLRRLQTPRGAALAWTEAAVLGDCRAYLKLSRPVDVLSERRTDDEICQALRHRTAAARDDAQRVRIEAGEVRRTGRTATAVVRVRRADGTVQATLDLVRHGADWLVLRDTAACGQIGCA